MDECHFGEVMNDTPTETGVKFGIPPPSSLSHFSSLSLLSFLSLSGREKTGKDFTEKISKIDILVQQFSVVINRVNRFLRLAVVKEPCEGRLRFPLLRAAGRARRPPHPWEGLRRGKRALYRFPEGKDLPS